MSSVETETEVAVGGFNDSVGRSFALLACMHMVEFVRHKSVPTAAGHTQQE